MKKNINIFLTLVMTITGLLAAYAASGPGNGYDPTNPPEPEEKYRLTVVTAPSKGGSISSYPQSCSPGDEVTLEAFDNPGFNFVCWKEGDITVSTERSYTFRMPSHSLTLVAFYEFYNPEEPVIKHSVRIYISPSEGGYVYPDQLFRMEEGESKEVYIEEKENYTFQGWKHDGKILPNDKNGNPQNPLTITMGDHELEYTAIFTVKSPIEPGTNSFNKATGKMVIDDFLPGRLADKVNAMLEKMYVQDNDDAYSSLVDEIVVVGPVSSEDYRFLNTLRWAYGKEFPNCTTIDFSRTTASESDNNYIPSDSFFDLTSLVKVVLPANISKLEYTVFNNCPSLSEIICYGTLPAEASDESFGDVPRTAVLRVPSDAMSLYRNAEGWKEFNIQSFDNEAYNIILSLPAEAKDGRYRSLILELINPESNRVQRLVVNDRLEYAFSNLIPDSEYNLYLRNDEGEILATVLSIKTDETAEKNIYLSLNTDDIKDMFDLTISVIAPGLGDVTENVEIQWKNENGDYISNGSTIKRVLEGTTRLGQISLSQDLGTQYYIPEIEPIVSSQDSKHTEILLVNLPEKSISGKVLDSETGNPVKNAYVSIENLISDKFISHSRTLTDNQGNFNIIIKASEDSRGKITCGANDYLAKTTNISDFSTVEDSQEFILKPITGPKIYTQLNWIPAGGMDKTEYSDYANLEFSLYNKTKNKPIVNFSNQCPYLILIDPVEDGDELEITVSSRKGEFENSTSSFVLNSSDISKASVDLVERGIIEVCFTSPDDETINVCLYDANGKLVKSTHFNDQKKASFANLKAGRYSLVAMRDSRFYQAVNTYEGLLRSGLKENENFAKDDIVVSDGNLAQCNFEEIPELPVPYFISDVTLAVNKTSLTVGGYVTVRASVAFKEEYGISNYSLRFDLPDQCSFVDESVIIGSVLSNGELDNGVLRIDNVEKGDLVRFCLMPEKGEEFRPTAFAEFEYDGMQYSLPIGSVRFTGEDFSIFVPKRTSRDYVYARGVASSVSDVTLHSNGIPSGNSRATADGNWVSKVDLIDPEETSIQQVYGEIVDSKGKKFSTVSTLVEYDPYFPELEFVRMVNNGITVNFNHTQAKTDRKSYSYLPANDMFSFMAKFNENKDLVSAVNFHIIATDGSEKIIDGVYVASTDSWVAAVSYPDSYRLPVNVTVDYCYNNPQDKVEFNMGYIAQDVTPIIDPSGFVYEAVEENRLEGVKVTVFYREGRENMFGEIVWNTVKWDAAEYAQENPLFTDEEGLYSWDVPSGQWQVKFEKEGYETAYSAWLPVPPPQLEVNMGLVQTNSPVVEEVHAYADGVDVFFDKMMKKETLEKNIRVTVNGEDLPGNVIFVSDTSDDDNESNAFVTKARFQPDESLASTTGELQLIVGSQVKSYAGVTMIDEYVQTITVEKEIKEIKSDNTSELAIGEPTSIVVSALPVDAAVGKTLLVKNDSPGILGIESETSEFILDENGQAEITLTGYMPGKASLTFSVNGSDEFTTDLEVITGIVFTRPNASLASGTEIYDGTSIELTSKTPDVIIYYTLDESEPTLSNGLEYLKPIIVDGGAVIKAIAVIGERVSDVAVFEYPSKFSKMDITLEDGWNWISHNFTSSLNVADLIEKHSNINQILSHDEEMYYDPKYGPVGDLQELTSGKLYKFRNSGLSSSTHNLKAVNPASPVRLQEGWNWIGYSSDQTMTPDEAFADMIVEEGDFIKGQEGFATFDGENWIGDLETLKPGLGYMYKSESEKDLRYNVSIVSNAGALYASIRKSTIGSWVVDKKKFPSVMPVIAEIVTSDGLIADENDYHVLAFCDSECRGIGKYIDGYLMMSVYGNIGDKIDIQLLSVDSERSFVADRQLTFSEDPVGSLDNPYQIEIAKSTGVTGISNSDDSIVYVIDNVLTVKGEFESIEIFDIDGHKVFASDNRNSVISLSGLRRGVHFVVVKADGIWSYHKIMIK